MTDPLVPATNKQQVIQHYSVAVTGRIVVPWYPYSRVLDVNIFPDDATLLHFWVVQPIWLAQDAPFTREFYVLDTGMPFPIIDIAEGSALGEAKTEGGYRVWQLIRAEPVHSTN